MVEKVQRQPLGQLQSCLQPYFGKDAEVKFPEDGKVHRMRSYPVELTFWAFLWQVLGKEGSCRRAVRQIQCWWQSVDPKKPLSPASTSYCEARRRLLPAWLKELSQRLCTRLEAHVTDEQLWCARRVRLMDGFGVSMPDSAANQKRWPQSSNQKEGCGFATAKVVALVCLHSRALIQSVEGSLRDAEATLARRLWGSLEKNDVLVADRAFGSYFVFAMLRSRGVDCLFRHHSSRPLRLREGKKLGEGDWLLSWKRPPKKALRIQEDQENYDSVEATQQIRVVRVQVAIAGFRTRTLFLVSTLCDAEAYPASKLRELYWRRWEIESHFRDLKTTLSMEVLRCKSPEMIEREMLIYQIAYNLVCSVMQEAALLHQVDLSRISFQGTLDTLRTWAPLLDGSNHSPAQHQALYSTMLGILAKDLVPLRPFRSEPRAVKRRPKPFPWLTKPRSKFVLKPRQRSKNLTPGSLS